MTDNVDTIDASNLDAHTLREIKSVVEAYPVVSASYDDLDDYRAGKHDALTTVAAVISQTLDEIDES